MPSLIGRFLDNELIAAFKSESKEFTGAKASSEQRFINKIKIVILRKIYCYFQMIQEINSPMPLKFEQLVKNQVKNGSFLIDSKFIRANYCTWS